MAVNFPRVDRSENGGSVGREIEKEKRKAAKRGRIRMEMKKKERKEQKGTEEYIYIYIYIYVQGISDKGSSKGIVFVAFRTTVAARNAKNFSPPHVSSEWFIDVLAGERAQPSIHPSPPLPARESFPAYSRKRFSNNYTPLASHGLPPSTRNRDEK